LEVDDFALFLLVADGNEAARVANRSDRSFGWNLVVRRAHSTTT